MWDGHAVRRIDLKNQKARETSSSYWLAGILLLVKNSAPPLQGGLGRLSAHKNSHEIRIILIILIWILLSLSL